MDIPVINVNTALEPVLYAIVQGLAGDDRKKSDLFDGLIASRTKFSDVQQLDEEESGDFIYFTNDDLSPYNLLNKIELTSDVQSVSLALQLVRHLTVDSKLFRVNLITHAEAGNRMRKAECVLGERETGASIPSLYPELAVLAWHETR